MTDGREIRLAAATWGCAGDGGRPPGAERVVARLGWATAAYRRSRHEGVTPTPSHAPTDPGRAARRPGTDTGPLAVHVVPVRLDGPGLDRLAGLADVPRRILVAEVTAGPGGPDASAAETGAALAAIGEIARLHGGRLVVAAADPGLAASLTGSTGERVRVTAGRAAALRLAGDLALALGGGTEGSRGWTNVRSA